MESKMLKKQNLDCILISFDYKKDDSANITYAIASLIKYSQDRGVYIKNYSLDMNSIFTFDDVLIGLGKYNIETVLKDIKNISISCYVWSKKYINDLIDFLYSKGFNGKIILGGYEITYNRKEDLNKDYPRVNIFISGDGEKTLYEAIKSKEKGNGDLLNKKTNLNELPLVYSSEFIYLSSKNKVNIETKRGCPYSCSFCAHKDLENNKYFERNIDDIKRELLYLNQKKVKKVNFLDPIFNIGKSYIDIVKYMVEIDFQPKISFQTRFELIKGVEGKEFLELASKLNVDLEFGLQTIIPEEYNIINRKNKKEKIIESLKNLNDLGISYEVSLIYGLPNQTVETFKKSIEFLKENGCKRILAFPLMLLVGTKLYSEKEKYNLIEEEINSINYVVSSNTFSKSEYKEMEKIAKNL